MTGTASVIVFGLASSTVLNMLVVPAPYSALHIRAEQRHTDAAGHELALSAARESGRAEPVGPNAPNQLECQHETRRQEDVVRRHAKQ